MASSPDGLIGARYAVITKTPGWEVLGGGGGGYGASGPALQRPPPPKRALGWLPEGHPGPSHAAPSGGGAASAAANAGVSDSASVLTRGPPMNSGRGPPFGAGRGGGG